MQKIGIIGAGAWGTALAQCMAGGGMDVLIWAREPEVAESINTKHENELFIPGVPLNPAIEATTSMSKTADCDTILIVTPAQHVRSTLESLKGDIAEHKPIVICSKGIEIDTGLLMSQVAKEEVPNATIAILTGPTFAAEIARGMPSAVTIAAKDKDVAQEIREGLASKHLRPYITDDLIGTEIGGAVKNVIAIACGIAVGRGLGESARAALMTRGLAEMGRLASAMGARKETLMGMCGVGDLMLTCSSMQSRNYSLGVELGQGKSLEDIMEARKGKAVTEGVHTAAALKTMARKHAVDMPICEIVHKAVGEGIPIEDCIAELLDRPLRPEMR
ncbi:MAG: NAD(P)-dependent glycerol-3-phosphate dehydrogenase [Rhodospirillales bacterium]|nr:NAD(P)-dependent glycerol-3-phosphate dehydrogenase [Rhodospirillales bacterium]MCB9996405.1 NAD(P)-dependent glycerol-3-phosphate dehydrogenase [Rhodospirillales bacterium]